jgi:hypothetical protein
MVDFAALAQKAREKRNMPKTTALANYDEDLARLALMGAKTAAARAGTTAKTIGTQGAHFTIDGKVLKETTLDVVVEDFILLNALYKPGTKFDPKNPASPICYAMEREEDEMVAHPDSLFPQGGTKYEPKGGTPGRSCIGCWANEWESSDGPGKGKACKNTTRLGLITADSIKSAETIEAADVRFITVPVTSGRAWAAHEENVRETFSLPVLGVVTQMEISPAEGGGHRLDFEVLQEVDKNVIGPLIEKHKEVAKVIDYPFMKPDANAKPGAGGRSAPVKAPAKSARPSSKGMADAAPAKRTTKY